MIALRTSIFCVPIISSCTHTHFNCLAAEAQPRAPVTPFRHKDQQQCAIFAARASVTQWHCERNGECKYIICNGITINDMPRMFVCTLYSYVGAFCLLHQWHTVIFLGALITSELFKSYRTVLYTLAVIVYKWFLNANDTARPPTRSTPNDDKYRALRCKRQFTLRYTFVMGILVYHAIRYGTGSRQA